MQGQTPSYVLTQQLTAPESTQLTTLANVVNELDIPSSDTTKNLFLNRVILEESAAIARYCNRIFGLATWQDEYRPMRNIGGEGVRAANNPLVLKRWPLVADMVAFVGNTYAGLVLVDGIASTSGLEVGQLVSGPGITVPGTTIASVSTNSLTLSQPASSSNPAANLCAGISVVETIAGTPTGLTASNIVGVAAGTIYDFEIEQGTLQPGDEGVGRLYRLNSNGNPRNWPAAVIVVTYQAGYGLPNDSGNTLPPDIETACIRLVVARFRARGRDPYVVERAQTNMVGSERYWVGQIPGGRGQLPPEVLGLLDPYRVPVVA